MEAIKRKNTISEWVDTDQLFGTIDLIKEIQVYFKIDADVSD